MTCIECLRTYYSDHRSTPDKQVYMCADTGKEIEDISSSIPCSKGLTIVQLHEKMDVNKGKK